MSSDFAVNEEVEDLIREIIARNNLQRISHIKYEAGSQVGDGYASKTVAVDIINGDGTFRVFLKCPLNVQSTEMVPLDRLYTTEIFFYDVVYPAYLKFLEERGVEDGFRHAPKCYGTSTKNIVALENLKDKGYALFDRKQTMNDSHLTLTLKTFAKFHAISFAYKDQKREEYDKLVENTFDFLSTTYKVPGIIKMMENLVNDFTVKLDPIDDKHILDKCDGLALKLHNCTAGVQKSLNEYSIITQGDCWCNNIMFLYGEGDDKNPIDIRLIDWQILRPASPVFDVSYFFYTIASAEALDKLQYYLRVYHEELTRQIRQLGSDPEILYPFEVLEREWKQHGKYGFAMAFTFIRMMLSSRDETFTFEELDMESAEAITNCYTKLKNEDEYIGRMKALANHMVKNNYI